MILAYYGYAWLLVNSNENGIGAPATRITSPEFMLHKEIKDYNERYGAKVSYNETYVVNYCTFGIYWISFDDVDAVRAKVSYAKKRGLLGYHVWQVSYDDNWILSQAAGSVDSVQESRSQLNNNAAAGDFSGNAPTLVLYSFADIEAATNKFSMEYKLGEGGYGPVYKGVLHDGQEVAVKKLSKTSTQRFEEFKNEVMLTAKLQHVNLVQLVGFCIDKEEHMLIYEYMSNKSLDYYLFGRFSAFQLLFLCLWVLSVIIDEQ
ncbi:hypothetical protein ACOSP7_012431 [Xanthoceras sorbifolium]